jgi:hypothetical protein
MDKFAKERATELLKTLGVTSTKKHLTIAAQAIDNAYTDGFEDGASEGGLDESE